MDAELVRVLVVGSETDYSKLIADAFSKDPTEFQVEYAGTLSTGIERVTRSPVDIVLLDLAPPDCRGLETFLRMREHARDIPIIAMSSEDDAGLALHAVREGAQDYLVRGRISGPALLRCVRHTVERHRHLAKVLREGPKRGDGAVISFLGVKGGVGTTTVALNVAAAMGQQGVSAIAVELQPSSQFSLHLRKSHPLSLEDLLVLDARHVDPQMVEDRLVRTPFGFRVLFGPQDRGGVHEIPAEHASALMSAGATLADYTLVDLSSQVSAAHKAAVKASRFVCVVLEPEPLSLKAANVIFQFLESCGLYSGNFGLILVNKQSASNSAKPQDVRAATGCEIVGVVPSAADACATAAEAGKPLYSLRPQLRFSATIEEITRNLREFPVRTLKF